MRHLELICILSLAALGAACAAEESAPAEQPIAGSGGSAGSTSSMPGGADGSGGSGARGGTSDNPIEYETAVGAVYESNGDARIVLIDLTGTRSALYNPSTGGFESADDIDELEGGVPLDNVAAAASFGTMTYFFDADGLVTIYYREQSTFSAPVPMGDVFEDSPFARAGAALGVGSQLFVFSEGGTSYAAYNLVTFTWSRIFDFVTEFGGGGAPIASVGAAYVNNAGGLVLFDVSGGRYCVYAGNGEFSDAFDIDELGNGSLTFNDE